MKNNVIRRLGVLAAALVAATSIHAATTTLPKGLTALQRQHVADLHRQQDLGPRAAAVHRGADTKAPKLTMFNAQAQVNANLSFSQLAIDMKATDFDSGIEYVFVYATSPSGQYTGTGYSNGYPAAQVHRTVGMSFNRYSEPGDWTVTEVDVYDAAGNVSSYDAAQLALLGNTVFTVKNDSWARDVSPPVLTTARVLTPDVPLTDGTNLLSPWIGVSMTAVDTGSPRAAGVNYMAFEFCTLDLQHCFATGWSSTWASQARTVATPGVQLYGGSYPAGTYYLYYTYVVDWAGNAQYLTGSEFGGDTDFSTLFPAGHTMTLSF